MKFKPLLLAMLCGFPTALYAHWQNVGKADYTWGPFYVYSLSLYTETGAYRENERPLMLSFKYAKPVEGKNFSITLIKEINKLDITKQDTSKWLNDLQRILPDFSPNDTLSYIALEDKGYFVLNDTVLNYEFDAEFNQALTAIWLSPKSSFPQLRSVLLEHSQDTPPPAFPQPETAPLDEENANPELPPNYPLERRETQNG